MSQGRDIVNLAIVLVTLGVILLVTTSIFGIMADTSGEVESGDRDTLVEPNAGGFVDIYDTDNSFYEERGKEPTVRTSRNLSRRFTGAPDSHLTSDDALTVATDKNWTVHQGVWVNGTATGRNMTVLALGDPDVLLRYDGNRSSAVWRVVYVGVSNTYETTVSAPSPTDATHLFVGRNNETLYLNRNNSANATVSISGASTGETNLTAAKNLDGRLDETRTWDSRLNSSQRQAVIDDPVAPLPGTNRTARIMYDELAVSPVNVFFAGGTATVSNATIADGFNGTTLTRDTLTTNGEYKWRNDGPELKILADSDSADAPAVYVEWRLIADGENPVLNGIASALRLSALLPVLLVLTMVVALLAGIRSKR